MSSRARSFSDLWNDINQDEALFVLQVIPDKNEEVIPGAGIHDIIVVPRFEDVVKAQQGKIYLTLSTRQINFWDSSAQLCCVNLPSEMNLQSLQGDEYSDSAARRQTKKDIFNFANQQGYPFIISSIGERPRVKRSQANPTLMPVVILSPNTAIAYPEGGASLEQFEPSRYGQGNVQLLKIEENAGMFRLHFSPVKKSCIITQTATKADRWAQTEMDLGVYYFQVTKENGIEIEDPEKGTYFPLYYQNSQGEYKICHRFRQMNRERIANIKAISIEKSKREQLSLIQLDEYKRKLTHSHRTRQDVLKMISNEYTRKEAGSLIDTMEAKYAEQIDLYTRRFITIKESNAKEAEKRQRLVTLKEQIRSFLVQEISQGAEDVSYPLHDSLIARVNTLIRTSINPQIAILEEKMVVAPLPSFPHADSEPMLSGGYMAQLAGYAKHLGEIMGSKASTLRKLQQLKSLKMDVAPFIPVTRHKFPLEDYEDMANNLMGQIRKEIPELRNEFRRKVIGCLTGCLDTVKEENEKKVIVKMLIHLKSMADLPLIDATREEDDFIVGCSSDNLKALTTDGSFAFLEVDRRALENEQLLAVLMSITVYVPDLREALLAQIIGSNRTAIQKLQQLQRLKNHIGPFEEEDDTAKKTIQSIEEAIGKWQKEFLNIEAIKSLEKLWTDLETEDVKSATRITLLGWSTRVPVPASDSKVAEVQAIKTTAIKIMIHLKLWAEISTADFTPSESEMVKKNPLLLEKGLLLDALTRDEQKTLEDSELQRILTDIVSVVPELQPVLLPIRPNESGNRYSYRG